MKLIGLQKELGVIPESLILSPIKALVAAWNNKVAASLDQIVPEQFLCAQSS